MKKDYGFIVSQQVVCRSWRQLVYAIMIVENFNRPAFFRALERQVLFKFGGVKTLGIMQVTTSIEIDDHDSVRLGTALIYDLCRKIDVSGIEGGWDSECKYQIRSKLEEVALKYNPSQEYAYAVMDIFEMLERKEV